MLYKVRNSIIEFYNYSSILSKAKSKARNESAKEQEAAGLKILTHKQMLQRSPIALAQVKAGNTQKVY